MRFAPDLLLGAFLEVEEERFDGKGIRALYDSPDYPLPRRKPKAAATQSPPPPRHPAAERTRWRRQVVPPASKPKAIPLNCGMY